MHCIFLCLLHTCASRSFDDPLLPSFKPCPSVCFVQPCSVVQHAQEGKLACIALIKHTKMRVFDHLASLSCFPFIKKGNVLSHDLSVPNLYVCTFQLSFFQPTMGVDKCSTQCKSFRETRFHQGKFLHSCRDFPQTNVLKMTSLQVLGSEMECVEKVKGAKNVQTKCEGDDDNHQLFKCNTGRTRIHFSNCLVSGLAMDDDNNCLIQTCNPELNQ